MSDRDRVLATVLFTDIVGSTERAARVGDASWRELMGRHHAAVRREVRRFGGREQDSAGDGFFLAFERPLAALRCAAAILDAVGSLGLEERAAVHTGEVERMQGKLGGIAVHTAARMLAIAGPGEVMVSATTRDLVAGAGLRFEDRGGVELKGLPEPVHLYALADPGALLDQSAQPVHAPGPRLANRSTAVGAMAVVAVAVVAALAFALSASALRSSRSGESGPVAIVTQSGGSPPGSSSTAASATAVGGVFPANLPANGPIPPGTYLVSGLRGGVILTVPGAYWTSIYNVYWEPSSYPDTHLWLVQQPPPSNVGCGSASSSAVAPNGFYNAWIWWFTHEPTLATSAPIRRLFGRTGALELDLRPVAARPCPTPSKTGATVPQFIAESKLVRAYVIDSPDPFLVVLGAPTEQQRDAATTEVEAMLTTLRFEP